jgi:histidinol dehydrogenase
MSTPMSLRYSGRWESLTVADTRSLVERSAFLTDDVRAAAQRIVRDVRARGDIALRELALQYDGVALESLEVPTQTIRHSLDQLPRSVRGALERAAGNIERVHAVFAPVSACVSPEPGITVQRRPDPLACVGIYAPGGRASYPSSVLMAAVPARTAGVRSIMLASPPGRSGVPSLLVLGAAAIAGVDRVFAVGGAGAIAAMAHGTETIPRADRIVGPGNAYVAAAKLLVTDRVAIDCPAGPSELVVIADESANPDTIASEMIAQAEHDPSAFVIALVIGAGAASALRHALDRMCERAARRTVVAAALEASGGIIECATLEAAVAAANAIAPEHLLIATHGPEQLLPLVRNAGAVFVGEGTSVVHGDYMTGANHVLPTGGAARSYSGLSPLDFVRWTTIQSVTREAAAGLARDVAELATAEGLPGHATAVLAGGVS